MFTLSFDWKKEVISGDGTEESPYVYGDSYNVCLDTIAAYMRENAGEHFCGISANAKIEFHFSQEPSQSIKDLVVTYWNLITSESEEAANYCSHETKQEAIDTLKAGLASKTWDEMSVAERKIVLNQTPTKAELGL